MNQNKWCVILNPGSGNGETLKLIPEINRLLTKYNLEYLMIESSGPGDIIRLTETAIAEGFRKFIAVGGDGTLHEIVNGIFGRTKTGTAEITLAAIPVGTGNDWAKNNGLTPDIEKTISLIRDEKSYMHDIGKITFPDKVNSKAVYFLNFAGAGFDSVVVENMSARRFGDLSYFIALLKTFLFYPGSRMKLDIDGRLLERDVFTLMACNGRYAGSGMYIAPLSLPDDGLFDVTLVGSLGKLEILKSLPQLYNGKILNHPKVERIQCSTISIAAEGLAKVQADGELLGPGPVSFSIIKKGLRVVGIYPV